MIGYILAFLRSLNSHARIRPKKMHYLGENIIKIKCTDRSLYENSDFSDFIREFFAQPQLQNYFATEQVGPVLSSVGKSFPTAWKDPSFVSLLDWTCSEILKMKSDFGKPDATKLDIKRIWLNRMFQGSKGLAHNHQRNGVEGVAIFYISAPKNSGDLVFSDPDSVEKPLHAGVETGLLLIHSPKLQHFITEHKCPEPRTALVFEFKFN